MANQRLGRRGSDPQQPSQLHYLLSGKDESLLRGWDAFFLFHALLDPLHLVRGLDVDLYLFAGKSLDFDQHVAVTNPKVIGETFAEPTSRRNSALMPPDRPDSAR